MDALPSLTTVSPGNSSVEAGLTFSAKDSMGEGGVVMGGVLGS